MARQKQYNDVYVVGKTLSAGLPTPPKPVPPPDKIATETPAKKAHWKRWLLLIVVILVAPILVLGAWDVRNYSQASQKIFGSSNLLSGLAPATLKQGGSGHINILVVGYSADDPGHSGANLTDSIMILSLSTNTKTGYMLSIPRDLYVLIPGYGKAKINEAYQDGEVNGFNESNYPAGGMGLLEKTIADSVGVHADYYALINYAAVRNATNALGGITVNIQSSDPRGIFDPNFPATQGGPLQLNNGLQKIDGLAALRLTRARGAAGNSYGLAQSDFDRTKNQQAVMLGIKNAITWKILINPLKNKKLLDGVGTNISTDIEISDVLPLYKLFNQVPSPEMKSVTLRDLKGQNLLKSYTTPTGQSALIPAAGINDYSDIQSAINSLD